LLPLSQFPHFLVKTIGYLYGCFHIASHNIVYGMMSSKRCLPSITVELEGSTGHGRGRHRPASMPRTGATRRFL
jgi:hypothetical protein